MLGIFAVILGLLAVCLFGATMVTLIRPNAYGFETLALSYLLGMGVFTFVLFLANIVGIKFELVSSSLILLGLITCGLTMVQVFGRSLKEIPTKLHHEIKFLPSCTTVEKGLLAGIIFVVSTAVIISSYWPVRDWDSIVSYDFRAKTFVVTGSMETGLKLGYFLGYPLMTTLGHTWVYLLGFPYPGIVHSLWYLSLVILLCTALAKRTSRAWALGWSLVFCFSSGLFDHALMTYTNLAYATYLIAGYFYTLEWLETRKNDSLILSGTLIGLSTWARSAEPFWLIPLFMVLVAGLLQKEIRSVSIYSLLILMIRQPWKFFESLHPEPTRLSAELSKEAQAFIEKSLLEKVLTRLNIPGIWEVMVYFWQYVISPTKYQYIALLLAGFITLSLTKRKMANPLLQYLLIAITLNIAGVMAGIFQFSIFFREWREIGGSAERMSLFLGPLILFFVALTTYQLIFMTKIRPVAEKSKIKRIKK